MEMMQLSAVGAFMAVHENIITPDMRNYVGNFKMHVQTAGYYNWYLTRVFALTSKMPNIYLNSNHCFWYQILFWINFNNGMPTKT